MIIKLRDPMPGSVQSDAWIYIDGIRRLSIDNLSVCRDPNYDPKTGPPEIEGKVPDRVVWLEQIQPGEEGNRAGKEPIFDPLHHFLVVYGAENATIHVTDDTPFYRAAVMYMTNGDIGHLYFSTEAYLMNDAGKTIQRYPDHAGQPGTNPKPGQLGLYPVFLSQLPVVSELVLDSAEQHIERRHARDGQGTRVCLVAQELQRPGHQGLSINPQCRRALLLAVGIHGNNLALCGVLFQRLGSAEVLVPAGTQAAGHSGRQPGLEGLVAQIGIVGDQHLVGAQPANVLTPAGAVDVYDNDVARGLSLFQVRLRRLFANLIIKAHRSSRPGAWEPPRR